MTKKRSYTMRKRAQSQAETRQRIVEAAMRLHEEVGPRATTISAVAERAGVQRLTVYRHFPDEAAVFQACTSHWLSLHPLPDPAAGWQDIDDPRDRLRAALDAFYGYYRQTARMWDAATRDAPEVPALRGPMQEVARRLDEIAAGLVDGFKARGATRTSLAATIRHAIAYSTWASLRDRGLKDAEMAALALDWAAGVLSA